MRPKPPEIPDVFPMARAALAGWDRLNRLAVIGSFLDSLAFVYMVPRTPRTPGSPAARLGEEAWPLIRGALVSGRPEEAERIQAEQERATEPLRAYESASMAHTFKLRLGGLALGFLVHIAFLGAIAFALTRGEGLALLMIGLWASVALGAGLACRAWVAPVIHARPHAGDAGLVDAKGA